MTTTADHEDGSSMESEIADLTAFQRDIILCIGLEGPQKGLSIKQWLQEHGYGEVHHGRLYPNLDELVGKSLVSKSERDKRTNEYSLRAKGRRVVDANAAAWQQAQSEVGKRGDA